MSTFNMKKPAFSHRPDGWHDINWRAVHQKVRGLQVRIAKAAQDGKSREVAKLQRMIVHSFSARALAVKRVTENQGKNTPGVDGETWDTPDAKWQSVLRLTRKGYKPMPLKRVYIPKSNGKRRPLGIPTMLDRAMQALYLLALEPVSETIADRNSYGFRPQRAASDAIEQCFINLSRKHSAQWVLEGDIKGCFDNISHEWLLNHVPMDKKVLAKWLKSGYMEFGKWNMTSAGTPQGGIISPVLANIALDGLEECLYSHFGKKNTKLSYKTKVNFVRYADDFVITGISREMLETEVKPLVESFMAKRGLQLSQEKTVITNIDDGFDFLGQNIRKYSGKLLIKPSTGNVKRFLAEVKRLLDDHKTLATHLMIKKLNPVITGWANYHKGVVAKETFNYVDYRIWKMLWRWCKRRHKNRGKRWIKKKYFKTVGKRNWVFHARFPDGGSDIYLQYANDIAIKRHIKIKSESNPYNPVWEQYFEARLECKWKGSKTGRRKLQTLWVRQLKRCPICDQLITPETGWNIHHIVERVKGGSDDLENLVLLHPNCHRQLHSNCG